MPWHSCRFLQKRIICLLQYSCPLDCWHTVAHSCSPTSNPLLTIVATSKSKTKKSESFDSVRYNICTTAPTVSATALCRYLCFYPVKSLSTICFTSAGSNIMRNKAPERLTSLLEIPYNTKKFFLTLQSFLIRTKFCGMFWHVSRSNRKTRCLACTVPLRTFNLKLFLYKCLKFITRRTFCSSDWTQTMAWLYFELKRTS
jgi:hypothetical protein